MRDKWEWCPLKIEPVNLEEENWNLRRLKIEYPIRSMIKKK